jgi:hypothetical protein
MGRAAHIGRMMRMRETVKTIVMIIGIALLVVGLVGHPILSLGAAYDAGTLTGRLVSRSILLLVLAKPCITLWLGFFDDEKE